MVDKIRWGVISTANIGLKRVIPAIQQSSNGDVVAIASRDIRKAESAASALNIPHAYGSYEALITSPNIDAIYNPLPNSEHAQWSIRAAEAGIPALCEKPLARNAAQAQEIVDAFAARNVTFAEAFMYRFHPQTSLVKEIVARGGIGELQLMLAAFTFPVGDEANIRLSKALAGGSLMDVGCYCLNVFRLMSGEEPSEAHAFAQIGKQSGVDETMSGVLQFPSGLMAHFDCGLRSFRVHMYEIRGSEGRIVVPEGFVMNPEETTVHYWHHDDYEAMKVPAANHYTLMVEDFADALINLRPPRFLAQDAVDNMWVVDQIIEAIKASDS
jgi:predicted dehydrogenase